MNFRALILLVESSGDWWQTHLVVLVLRTWHLHDWRRLNGSNISLRSYPLSPSLSAAAIGYQPFVVETIVVAIKEARWKEVSILTSVHLSRPLSLCLPLLAPISHLSLLLNNEQSHLFSETRVFRTCYQLDGRNHAAASNTRDENTRCKRFIPVQAFVQRFSQPNSRVRNQSVILLCLSLVLPSHAEISQSPIFHPAVQTLKVFLLWVSCDPVKMKQNVL